jgi:uncharacterized membrane protein YozB (DUF420 family)
VPTGPTVILILKTAVAAVTILLAASLIAVVRGKVRLHGRINLVFFALTLATLLGFEGLLRVVNPDIFLYIKDNPDLYWWLTVHLYFSVPSALLMPFMLWTGLRRNVSAHLAMALVFGILWTGTFVTGVFFLPH